MPNRKEVEIRCGVSLCSGMQAALGRQAHFGSNASRDLLEEVRSRRDLCNEVANEIEQYLKNAAAVDGTAVRAALTARSLGARPDPSDSS